MTFDWHLIYIFVCTFDWHLIWKKCSLQKFHSLFFLNTRCIYWKCKKYSNLLGFFIELGIFSSISKLLTDFPAIVWTYLACARLITFVAICAVRKVQIFIRGNIYFIFWTGSEKSDFKCGYQYVEYTDFRFWFCFYSLCCFSSVCIHIL